MQGVWGVRMGVTGDIGVGFWSPKHIYSPWSPEQVLS